MSGRTLRVLSKQNPISGVKLYLTLDAQLQQKAYDAFDGKRGAAVAIEVKNGNVLALVSSPGYDSKHLCEWHRQKRIFKFSKRAFSSFVQSSSSWLISPGIHH